MLSGFKLLVFLSDLVVDRQLDVQLTQAERERERIFVWDWWLSGLCTCIQAIDPGFDPGQESVLSFSCVS